MAGPGLSLLGLHVTTCYCLKSECKAATEDRSALSNSLLSEVIGLLVYP